MALLYVVTCGGLVDTVIVKVKLLPAKNINENQEKLITKHFHLFLVVCLVNW